MRGYREATGHYSGVEEHSMSTLEVLRPIVRQEPSGSQAHGHPIATGLCKISENRVGAHGLRRFAENILFFICLTLFLH